LAVTVTVTATATVSVSGRPPERLLMVAAHAWDLSGAQGLGPRTAYVAAGAGAGAGAGLG
jgi:hypothetical protein